MDQTLVGQAEHPSYSHTRRFLRVPADLQVRLSAVETRLADRVRDLSEGGVGVVTSQPLQPRTRVTVELEFPHYRVPIVTTGVVVWSTDTAMGIRFDRPDQVLCDAVLQLQRGLERL
jgi:hypothetical protein